MGSLGKLYKGFLTKYPILSQAAQTSILMGCGDTIAQVAIEKKSLKNYNFVRTGQFAAIGFFVTGPGLTMWYRLLAKQFGNKGTGTVVLKKVAADQLLFAPCFIAVFIASISILQLKKSNEIVADVQKNYKDIVITNYKLWPAVQLVNFYVVPLQYQVLFVQCVAIFWNTYLSWKTQSSGN